LDNFNVQGGAKKVHFFGIWKFIFLKMSAIGEILCGESIARIFEIENASLALIQGKSDFRSEKCLFSHFAANATKTLFASKINFSLNQDQERVFSVLKCVQSIPRIKLSL
jgi:hypothetical protein